MPPGFAWNEEKNQLLIRQRGVSFNDVVAYVESRSEVETYDHPNQRRYPRQRIYIVDIDDYLFVVPFVLQEDGTAFLKTIYPSNRARRYYGRRRIR